MKMKRDISTILRTCLIALFIILLMNTAHAIGIGAGPGVVYFNHVLRGGYGENTIVLTNPDENPAYIVIETEGYVGDWLSFELGKNFTIPAKTTLEFKAIVKPPLYIAVGNYTGSILIGSTPLINATIRGHGTTVTTGALLQVSVNLTGEQILDYIVRSISVKDTEEGYPIEFSVSGENLGNVEITPQVHVDIWNKDKTKLVKSSDFVGNGTLPTRKETYEFSISSENMSVGQYWADVNVAVGKKIVYQELLTFDLMVKGSMKIKGELIGIVNKVWVKPDEVVRIDAIFKNTGELPTYAKYKGEVYLGDEIVAVLESEELMVRVGDTVNLTTYFTPKKSGRYVARGAVFYEKKITFTKEGIINVLPEESILMLIFSDKIFYVVIIILLIIILIKILPRKETDSLSSKYLKLDDKLEKAIRDGRKLQARMRESKDRLKR